MDNNRITRTYNALPQAIEGFENIVRYWDEKHKIYAAKIMQGDFYVTIHGEMIATVLGSCVSACIRDTRLGIGGMNHFMLPEFRGMSDEWKNSPVNVAARYGNVAMEKLVNTIMSAGGNKKYFEAKIFGGGNLLEMTTDIGQLNIDFVKSFLRKEGIKSVAEDVGGIYPRKLIYYPSNGVAKVKKIRNLHNDTLQKREINYINRLKEKAVVSEIEIFE